MADNSNFKFARISALGKLHIYALHGYATEVMFTALWEFVVNLNWKFPGITSVWSFPIYGISGMVCERMYESMSEKKIPLIIRALIYTLWTYCWEFSTGLVLKQFGACPWDYTPFHGDFMGLVTLEYAPLWFLGAILQEKVIIYYVKRLYVGPTVEETQAALQNQTLSNGMGSQKAKNC